LPPDDAEDRVDALLREAAAVRQNFRKLERDFDEVRILLAKCRYSMALQNRVLPNILN
jgi:hypothetical protein